MYLDVHNRFPRWDPEPRRQLPAKRLTTRQEKLLIVVVSVYLLLTFIAPIGGASLLQAFIR